MPFVRISLLKGKPTEYQRALSDSVHQALMDTFGIPELDKFQVIEEVELENLIFPPSYMSIPHTANIVYIQIIAKEGRTTTMKQALFARIAQLIKTSTDLSANDVVITLIENKAENWSFGQGVAQLISAERPDG